MSLSHDLPTQPERAASPCCWRYRGGAPAPRGAQWESGTERPPAMTSGSADRGRQTPSWANSRYDRARGRVVSSVVFRGSRPDSAALAGGRIEQRGRSRARNGPSVARVGVGLGPGASSLPASPAPPNSPPNHLSFYLLSSVLFSLSSRQRSSCRTRNQSLRRQISRSRSRRDCHSPRSLTPTSFTAHITTGILCTKILPLQLRDTTTNVLLQLPRNNPESAPDLSQ